MNEYLDIFSDVLRLATFQPRYHERRRSPARPDEDYAIRTRNSLPERIVSNDRPR